MNRPYQDTEAFREGLQSQANEGLYCRSCLSSDGPLVSFNVPKDFGSLDLPTAGCGAAITPCPARGVADMNSFNVARKEKQGEGPPDEVGALGDYLAFDQSGGEPG